MQGLKGIIIIALQECDIFNSASVGACVVQFHGADFSTLKTQYYILVYTVILPFFGL